MEGTNKVLASSFSMNEIDAALVSQPYQCAGKPASTRSVWYALCGSAGKSREVLSTIKDCRSCETGVIEA
jgi:hypothetical protein